MKSICARMGGMCDGSMRCDTCFYYTRTFKAEVEDEPTPTEAHRQFNDLLRKWMDQADLSDSLIAAFEELAGEHERYLAHRGALPEPPGPGWYWVKGHWRSRTSPEARESQAPTGDKDGEPGESPASLQGQGDCIQDNPEAAELVRQGLEDCAEGRVSEVPSEVFRDGVTLWYCERCDQVVEHYPCKWCGFEGQPPGYKCGTCFDLGLSSRPSQGA